VTLRPNSALFRKRVIPCTANGLQVESDIMVDKISAIPRAKVGKTIGRLQREEMAEITALLAIFLGL
jgi:mRNA interferase MazF